MGTGVAFEVTLGEDLGEAFDVGFRVFFFDLKIVFFILLSISSKESESEKAKTLLPKTATESTTTKDIRKNLDFICLMRLFYYSDSETGLFGGNFLNNGTSSGAILNFSRLSIYKSYQN